MVQCVCTASLQNPRLQHLPPHSFRLPLPAHPLPQSDARPLRGPGQEGVGGADDVMALVQMLLPLPPLMSQGGLLSPSLPTPLS